MSEDSILYRERAVFCAKLAKDAKAQDLKDFLGQIAKGWEDRANEAELMPQQHFEKEHKTGSGRATEK